MKLIAVSQRVVVDPKTGERRDALDQNWSVFLRMCGMIPVILPSDIETAQHILERIPVNGILLTGGNTHAKYGGNAPERDALDHFLIARRQAGIPLLGVCRGMQSIQIFFGAELRRVEGHVARDHTIRSEDPDSRDLTVNSYHEFAALECPDMLKVVYRSEDGVIEAVRHLEEPVAGIMWHPERNNPFNRHDVSFFQTFFGGTR